MKYLINDKLYTILKWIGLTACPALAVFYGACAPAWGWPHPEAVVLTLNAVGVLIGALIGVSAATAKPVSNDEYYTAPVFDGDDIPVDSEEFKVLTHEEAISVFEEVDDAN